MNKAWSKYRQKLRKEFELKESSFEISEIKEAISTRFFELLRNDQITEFLDI